MHDYVFTRKGKPFPNVNGFIYQFKVACKKADIPYGRNVEGGITLHDMRRTVKTNMLDAGIQKEYRDKILGHSLRGMDRRYLTPPEETLTEAMEQFTAWLDGKLAEVDKTLTKVA